MEKQYKNILVTILIVALLIISLSLAYYFVIFLPGVEKFEQNQTLQQQRIDMQKSIEEQTKQEHYASCQAVAENAAQDLLKEKVEINPNNKIWKQASEKGMYLKDDYNTYYDRCLARYGLQ